MPQHPAPPGRTARLLDLTHLQGTAQKVSGSQFGGLGPKVGEEHEEEEEKEKELFEFVNDAGL